MPTYKAQLAELRDMLSYHRPDGSKPQQLFCHRFLEPLGAKPDPFNNYLLRIGDAPILWSSHHDTIHRSPAILAPERSGNLFLAPPGASCLGADCSTGIWIMAQMIRRRVPGLYIFHAAEEIGGIGSRSITSITPEILSDIQFAIAFDRQGTSDIISHQLGFRCASDDFISSLQSSLGLPLHPAHGTFTDTANYTSIIPECTNISIGYANQHTASESQNISWAFQLLEAILSADFTKLVIGQKPAEEQEDYYSLSSRLDPAYSLLYDFCRDNPEVVADLLHELGYDYWDLETYKKGV